MISTTFRPISNLNFISKILEKVVASRIQSHLSSNSLSSSFQSAYRIFHSTETTLLKIHNDLILAMDRGEVTSLILLDLSAAFDTVDHSILLTRLQNWFGLDGLSLAWFTILSLISLSGSLNQWFHPLHSLLFPVVYPKVPYLAHYFLLSILLLFARWSQKIPSNIICMLMTPSCTSLSLLQILLYLLTHLPPLSMTFSPGWIWTNYSLIHQKLNFFSLAQNNNVSNFLILQTYLSAMISSQSVPLLAILASSLTLTCLSLIKSNLYPNLVIFISETSVEFVIFFLFLQLQLLQIHLSPANLTTVIHYTLASHKSISTNFNAFKTHWHASSQTPQNTNTSHQYSKNYTGFQSNKELNTNSVFSHTKHLQINNQHIFTIVFHFLHILFLQDLLIHSFFPFHMFDHHLAKGLSLSSVHVSGIHSLLIPETRLLYQYSVPGSKHTSSKLLSLPRLFPISLDCLPGFWFLLLSFYAVSKWHLVLDTGL